MDEEPLPRGGRADWLDSCLWTALMMGTYVPLMGLTWRATSTQRWRGVDDDGKHIGHVGLVVWGGDANSAWHGWRYDGSPSGIDLGQFDTAEQAMAAVDAADTSGPSHG